MSITLSKCQICGKYISITKEGRALHLKQYHGVTVRSDRPRMDPAEKARIVAAMELRLGLEHFVVPSTPLPKVVQAVMEGQAVPPAYCGPGGGSCVWETNGWDICGPCQTRRSWESSQPAPDEAIAYRD